ncbi:hypothetical protein [Escherichia coli IS35]|nr:hypothetical protein [Escherichia coli IS35]
MSFNKNVRNTNYFNKSLISFIANTYIKNIHQKNEYGVIINILGL